MILGFLSKIRDKLAVPICRTEPNRCLILLYHRIADLRHDPQSLSVSPANFLCHVKILSKSYSVLSLRELSDLLQEGGLPRKGIVVTFDDGYADNLINGKEILLSQTVPATVFVATGYIGENREFWWDEIERICFETRRLPGELRLKIDGTDHHWDIDGQSTNGEDWIEGFRHWTILSNEFPTARHRLYKALMEALHPLSHETQRELLDEIAVWAGIDRKARDTHRTMSEEEVRLLVQGGLIDIGAHTINHDRLSALSAPAQKRIIHESKRRLEELLQQDVASFSYPYGSIYDFSEKTRTLVKEEGFLSACTTAQTCVTPAADVFALPRLVVRNWSGDQFTDYLEKWYRI